MKETLNAPAWDNRANHHEEELKNMAQTKASRQEAAKKGAATRKKNAAKKDSDQAKRSASTAAKTAGSAAKAAGSAAKGALKSATTRAGSGKKKKK